MLKGRSNHENQLVREKVHKANEGAQKKLPVPEPPLVGRESEGGTSKGGSPKHKGVES